MTETVLDLITDTLLDLGTVAIDEVPSAAEAAIALRNLNKLIEIWNTEKLSLYTVKAHVFSLVASQKVYTLGTGGDWNIARPRKIIDAFARDAGGNDFPVALLSEQEYSNIVVKSIQSSLPVGIWDDNNFPLRNITVFPVPASAAYSMVLYTEDVLSGYTSTSDVLSLPPGYYTALQSNLVIMLAPKYGRAVSQELVAKATGSKSQLKRNNTNVRELGTPDALLTHRAAIYPWLNW